MRSATDIAEKESGITSGSIRILLIEDNPGEAHQILEMLKEVGKVDLQVDHATTLRDGLEQLSNPEKPLDVVLLDLGLPDSQGIETFKSLRDQPKRFTTIILSGLNDVDYALDAVRQGAKDYLVKGQINGNMLLHSIRHAIERDESERLLQESQQRYQNLIDVMPDGVLVHIDNRIAFANPAALKLIGAAKAEELMGKEILEIVHLDFQQIARTRMATLQQSGEDQPALEEKYVRLDGKVIDVEVGATQLIFEGKLATQFIIRNLTHRKQRERELEAMASVNQDLRTARGDDEILATIMDQALVSINATEGFITLEDQATGNHIVALGRGSRKNTVGEQLLKDTGLISNVTNTSQPYVNNHARSEPTREWCVSANSSRQRQL